MDFGNRLVACGKREIVQHMSARDLDECADLLLPKLSNDFLNRALERRLQTIEAKSLINALARAERLGYEPSDIVEDEPQVASQMPFGQAPSSQAYVPQGPIPPAPTAPAPAAKPTCASCHRTFEAKSAYDHVSDAHSTLRSR